MSRPKNQKKFFIGYPSSWDWLRFTDVPELSLHFSYSELVLKKHSRVNTVVLKFVKMTDDSVRPTDLPALGRGCLCCCKLVLRSNNMLSRVLDPCRATWGEILSNFHYFTNVFADVTFLHSDDLWGTFLPALLPAVDVERLNASVGKAGEVSYPDTNAYMYCDLDTEPRHHKMSVEGDEVCIRVSAPYRGWRVCPNYVAQGNPAGGKDCDFYNLNEDTRLCDPIKPFKGRLNVTFHLPSDLMHSKEIIEGVQRNPQNIPICWAPRKEPDASPWLFV
mmetsp:Transcript_38832/g.97833  ORF Transcript_38832/g.97833 Transcript_38832/m.97833 type:complete len:276 (+) Transcript_38832:24-851(+)